MTYLEHALNINWITAALALFVSVIIYLSIQLIQMPTGPLGLPYLGYYPFLRKDYHLQLRDMTKTYGDVFCLRLTGRLYVYLGSIRAIKEALVTKSDCFTQRPKVFSLFADVFGGGVVLENGEKWKELRKFFVQRLKEFGVSKKTQEGLVADFLEKTVNEIRKTDGENFDALTYFMDISTKIIYSILLSGYKVDDDDVRKFNEAYSATVDPMLGTTGLLTGPLLKLMMYIRPEFKRFRRNKFLMFSVLDKIIEEHEKSFKKDNIRNVVDHYINTRKLLKEKCDPKSKLYTGKALQRTLLQFIGDGGHFVGFTISLVLKALHDRPDTQKEIQREIDGTVGRSRFPSLDDRSRMPYTNAVIQECFRSTDVLPVVSSLECTKETTVGGCHVPKGAITLVGVWDSSHDPNVYEKPEEFDPTRFLPNEEQKPKCTPPPFFGIGKRSCIGEPFVFMETFLFVCTILQNFDLHPEKESGTDESPSKKQEASGLSVVFRATPRKS